VVKLRLMRMGKKKQPTYRIVAADSRSPRNGRFIEIVGTYEPRRDPSVIAIETDRAVDWLRKGAQPTERVEKLLKISGAWDVWKGLPEGTSVPAAPQPQAPKAKEAPAEVKAEEAAPPAEPEAEAEAPAEPAPEPEVAADEPAADEPAAEGESS
jgi:small subunit ribosomal protein S16